MDPIQDKLIEREMSNVVLVGDLNKLAMDRLGFFESKYQLVRVTPSNEATLAKIMC